MKIRIASENKDAESLLPPLQPDGSKIGVNYADAFIKGLNVQLEDGRKLACKRKGLKIVLSLDDRQGEAILRRLENGPDAKNILRKALEAAAEAAGTRFSVEGGVMYLELDPAKECLEG